MERVPIDLGSALGLAAAVVRLPVVTVPTRGASRVDDLADPGVVIRGVLLRSVNLRQRSGALLMGPGDVLSASADEPSPFVVDTRALVDARVAVLDRAALTDVAASPRLATGLADRVADQSDRAGMQTVLMQLPSISARLDALLPELSQRFGTVTGMGVTLPAYLSHSVLAGLIGVRRPSLTTAISELGELGRLQRLPDRRWLLDPDLAGLTQAA